MGDGVGLQVLQRALCGGEEFAARRTDAAVGVGLCVVHRRAVVAERHATNFAETGSITPIIHRGQVCWQAGLRWWRGSGRL